MNTKSSHKTPAVVLRCLDYGESDRIVTFYTLEFGKLSGIAKGAKKSQKRFANALEPFSSSHILFSKRGRDSLAFLENCDMINHYGAIREDLEKTLLASYLVDVTEQFTVEGKRQENLFHLLTDFLALIAEGKPTEGLIRFFEMRLLKLAGYEPVLDRCLACHHPVDNGDSYYFLPKDGGVRCQACRGSNEQAIQLSAGTIRSLLLGRDMETSRIGRLILSPQSADESRKMMTSFIRHILGRDLRSLQVLQQIRRLGI